MNSLRNSFSVQTTPKIWFSIHNEIVVVLKNPILEAIFWDRSRWDAVAAMRVGLSGAIYLRSDLRQRYEDLSSLKSLSVSVPEKVFYGYKKSEGVKRPGRLKKCLGVISNCQQTMLENINKDFFSAILVWLRLRCIRIDLR